MYLIYFLIVCKISKEIFAQKFEKRERQQKIQFPLPGNFTSKTFVMSIIVYPFLARSAGRIATFQGATRTCAVYREEKKITTTQKEEKV